MNRRVIEEDDDKPRFVVEITALNKGFTLVEIMVVVAIIGSVATAVAYGLSKSASARGDAARTQVTEVARAVESFAVSENRLPRHLGELIDDDYVDTRQTKDPWGRPLTYRAGRTSDAADFSLCSRGEDGHAGTEDDICTDAD